MKKFMLLMHENPEVLGGLSNDELQSLIAAHNSWAEELSEKGHFVGGDGLEDDGVVLQGKESNRVDGPHMGKSMVGGYYLLQGNNIEEVVEIAKGCPCHHWGGSTEIRPIMDYEE